MTDGIFRTVNNYKQHVTLQVEETAVDSGEKFYPDYIGEVKGDTKQLWIEVELNGIPLKMELDTGAMQYHSGEQDDVARQTRSSSFEQTEVSFANLFRAKASCARRGYSSSEDSLTAQATTIGGGGRRGGETSKCNTG